MQRYHKRAVQREQFKESSSKRAGDELEQESIKKQKVDEDKETSELKILMQIIPDEEEVAIDAIPFATKPPTIMYEVFSLMLKSFDRQYLEDLYNLVKAKYGSTRPVEDLDMILYGDLKTMFDPHVEDQVRVIAAKQNLVLFSNLNEKYAKYTASNVSTTRVKLVLLVKIEENILITIAEKIKATRRFSTIKERIKIAQRR
ncbi:hypothetical protein Tco_0443360 [Tanacetum coccineum]